MASRADMALEALILLYKLNDHRKICLALQQGKMGFCDWEKKANKRYEQLMDKVFGGKNALEKIEGVTIGECPTNVWFDNQALSRAKARNNLEVIK
jgi:hypothetical protein